MISEDFTVIVKGTNTITGTNKYSMGTTSGNMTVGGDGVLNLVGVNNNPLYSTKNVTITDSVTINMSSKGVTNCLLYVIAGTLTVSGGTLNIDPNAATGSTTSGIDVKNYVQTGGVVIASSEYDVTRGLISTVNGNLSISGGSVTVIATKSSAFGLYTTGKTATFEGGTVAVNAPYFFKQVNGTGNVVVKPGVVLDCTLSTAAISGDVTLTTTDVAWEPGCELTATAKTVKTLEASDAESIVDAFLSTVPVTNYLTKADLVNATTLFENATLTLNSAATTQAPGSWNLVVVYNDVTVERTLTIPQLPTLSFAFDSEEKGIATGTVSATFETYQADNYEFYWGTADGLLTGYRYLAKDSIDLSGNVLSYHIADRVVIPEKATHLWLTVDGAKVCSYEIPEARRSSFGAEKYTFGILSDVHFNDTQPASSVVFQTAMNVFKNKGVSFVSAAGDFTSNGDADQYDMFLSKYADYTDIPVFTATGNHDSLDWNIFADLTTRTALRNMMEKIPTYPKAEGVTYYGNNNEFKITATNVYVDDNDVSYIYDYSMEYGDDLFVYIGIGAHEYEDGIENTTTDQFNPTRRLTERQLAWVESVLANSDNYQDVFVSFHYPIKQTGIALYSNTEVFDELHELLNDHDNVIYLSGHTHNTIEKNPILSQTLAYTKDGDSYVAANGDLGYTAVHVPSNAASAVGYVATVYESGTLLTGYDFANDQVIPYATFFVANEEPKAEPTSENIDATVTLSDKTLNENDFEFVLMDGVEVLQSVKNDAEGKITFAAIEFTKPGVYTYTVKQTKGNTPGVTYDETAHTVTVTVVKEDGKLVATVSTAPAFKNQYRVPFVNDGVITEDGYFEVNGVPTEMGLFERDGAYYYAQYDGKIIKSQKYYVWKLSTNCGTMTEGWYAFDADGKVVENGMFTDSEGTTWYYENYAPKEKGLFKYGDNYYVAQYDGKIITSKSYEYNEVGGKYYVWLVDDTATDIGKGWRYFDENGLMLQGIQMHPEKNELYYFVDGQPKEMGLFKVGEDYYVAQYDGKIITSSNYFTGDVGGKYYVWLTKDETLKPYLGWQMFGADGKMILPAE